MNTWVIYPYCFLFHIEVLSCVVNPCLTARCRLRCVESVEEPVATAATHGRNHGPGDNPGGDGGLDRPRGRQATEERRSSVGRSVSCSRSVFVRCIRPSVHSCACAAFPLDLFLAGYMRELRGRRRNERVVYVLGR